MNSEEVAEKPAAPDPRIVLCCICGGSPVGGWWCSIGRPIDPKTPPPVGVYVHISGEYEEFMRCICVSCTAHFLWYMKRFAPDRLQLQNIGPPVLPNEC